VLFTLGFSVAKFLSVATMMFGIWKTGMSIKKETNE